MHLFNIAQFGQRFGIDLTVTDFFNATVEASKAATRDIAAMFRFGDFDAYTARRDIFQVDRTFGSGSNQYTKLLLARGFMDTSVGFTAYYTDNPVHVRNSDTNLLTDLQNSNEDGESDYLFIDANQGLLTVYTLDMTDKWVVVTYNGGLSVATDDEYEGVPDWLSQAAQAQAAIHLTRHRALQSEDDVDMRSVMHDQLKAQFQRGARTHLSAIPPTASEPGR